MKYLGFLIHYGALSATMWWLLISFNLFLTVVVKIRSTSRKRMEISFYLIGWGLPLVFCIIALGLRSYNYDGELLYCFINVVSYELALFYVPVMIVSIIGAVIIIWIVVRVVQSTLASKVKKKGNFHFSNFFLKKRVMFQVEKELKFQERLIVY